MGLLSKLRSLFGSSSDERSESSTDADVTIEYAPDAESEHAVKGTDEADVSGAGEADDDAETDESEAETESGGSEAETESGGSEAETESGGSEAETESGGSETETGSSEDGDTPESPGVGEVKGIGPTYSDRLGAAGIETVGDLAEADAEAVAEAAETSVTRAENWVERARSRT